MIAFHTAELLEQAQAETAAAVGMARLTAAETILIPAQERAAAAAAANAAAQTALNETIAEQSLTTRAAAGALGLLGGPLGLIITLLGAAATAWWVFGDKAKEAEGKSHQASKSVLEDLREQIKLLKERNRIQGAAVPSAAPTDKELERLRQLGKEKATLEAALANTAGQEGSLPPAMVAARPEWEKRLSEIDQEIAALKAAHSEIGKLTKEGQSTYRQNKRAGTLPRTA